MARLSLDALLNVHAQTRDAERAIRKLGDIPLVLNAHVSTKGFQSLTAELARVRKHTKEVETGFQDFADKAALAGKRFAAFTLATTGVFALASALRNASKEASDFQVELLKIKQVTRDSSRNVSGLGDEVFDISRKLGVSSKELLGVGLTLGQAGRSIEEIKQSLGSLAKTRLAATFGDITDTVNALIAAQEQFKISGKDTEQVLGSINILSARYAVEANDLTVAIQKAGGAFASLASSMDDPKENLNELLALFTAVRSTTRESADTIATGFRTIFARLRRPQSISTLEAFGINLKDDKGLLKKPLDQIRAISAAVKGLDKRDIRFSQIIEEVGGIRQQSKVIPLLEQMEKAERALITATQGANSLTRDAEIAQQSLANQLTKTREEFLKLINDGFKSDEFQKFSTLILDITKGFIEMGRAIAPIIPAVAALSISRLFVGSVGAPSGFSQITKGITKQFSGKASGGPIGGSGDGDTVPAMLTPGEFVIRKAAAKKIGAKRLHELNHADTQHFAIGGIVKFGRKLDIAHNAAIKKDQDSEFYVPGMKYFKPKLSNNNFRNKIISRYVNYLDKRAREEGLAKQRFLYTGDTSEVGTYAHYEKPDTQRPDSFGRLGVSSNLFNLGIEKPTKIPKRALESINHEFAHHLYTQQINKGTNKLPEHLLKKDRVTDFSDRYFRKFGQGLQSRGFSDGQINEKQTYLSNPEEALVQGVGEAPLDKILATFKGGEGALTDKQIRRGLRNRVADYTRGKRRPQLFAGGGSVKGPHKQIPSGANYAYLEGGNFSAFIKKRDRVAEKLVKKLSPHFQNLNSESLSSIISQLQGTGNISISNIKKKLEDNYSYGHPAIYKKYGPHGKVKPFESYEGVFKHNDMQESFKIQEAAIGKKLKKLGYLHPEYNGKGVPYETYLTIKEKLGKGLKLGDIIKSIPDYNQGPKHPDIKKQPLEITHKGPATIDGDELDFLTKSSPESISPATIQTKVEERSQDGDKLYLDKKQKIRARGNYTAGYKSHRTSSHGRNTAIDLLHQAVEKIKENRVTSHQNVVVLGRDGYPLLPLLREQGIPSQYFLYGRQASPGRNSPTSQQYLNEVPPGSLVVDTGFGGSILDKIRHVDKTSGGGILMSSSGRYLSTSDSDTRPEVIKLEHSPKLTGRQHSYDRSGNALFNPLIPDYDNDVKAPHDQVLLNNHLLLRELGLPEKTARRYRGFTGETINERLGLGKKGVKEHLEKVASERKDFDINEKQLAELFTGKIGKGLKHSELIKILRRHPGLIHSFGDQLAGQLDIAEGGLANAQSKSGNQAQIDRRLQRLKLFRTKFDKTGYLTPPIDKSNLTGFASGGPVGGSGRGDKIPAMLEPNEFVMPVDAVKKHPRGFWEALRRGEKPRGYSKGGSIQKFAGGGIVDTIKQNPIQGAVIGSVVIQQITSGLEKTLGKEFSHLGTAAAGIATQFVLLSTIMGTFGRTAKESAKLTEDSAKYNEQKEKRSASVKAGVTADNIKGQADVVERRLLKRDNVIKSTGIELESARTASRSKLSQQEKDDLKKVKNLQKVNEGLKDPKAFVNVLSGQIKRENLKGKSLRKELTNVNTTITSSGRGADVAKLRSGQNEADLIAGGLSPSDAAQAVQLFNKQSKLRGGLFGSNARKKGLESQLTIARLGVTNPTSVSAQITTNTKSISGILAKPGNADLLNRGQDVEAARDRVRTLTKRRQALLNRQKEQESLRQDLVTKHGAVLDTKAELDSGLVDAAEFHKLSVNSRLNKNIKVKGRRTKADLESRAKLEGHFVAGIAGASGIGAGFSTFGDERLKNNPNDRTGAALSHTGSVLSGAAEFGGIGLALGGPTGAAIGAIAGAGIGLASSLKKVNEAIRDVKLDEGLRKFNNILGLINDPTKKLSASSQVTSVRGTVKELNNEFIGSGGSKDIRDRAENLAGGLSEFLRNLAKSSKTFNEFQKDSKGLTDFVSRFTSTPIDELNRGFKDLIESTQRLSKIEKILTDASVREDTRAISSVGLISIFSDLSEGITEFDTVLSGGISDLSGVFKRLGQVNDKDLFGRANKQASSVLGGLGQTGQEFIKESNLINEVGKKLPTILTDVFKKNVLETEDGDHIGEISKRIKEITSSKDVEGVSASFIRNAVIGALEDKIKSGNIGAEIQGGNVKEVTDSILENLRKGIGEVLEKSIKFRNEELKLIENTLGKVTELRNEQNTLLVSNVDIDERRALGKTTNNSLSLAQHGEFEKRRLNLISGQPNNSVSELSNILKAAKERLLNLDKKKQDAPDKDLLEIANEREKELSVINKTTNALKFLGDVASRVAKIDEKIALAKQLRESKNSLAEDLAFAEPDQQREILKAIHAANTIIRTKDLNSVPPNLKGPARDIIKRFQGSQIGDNGTPEEFIPRLARKALRLNDTESERLGLLKEGHEKGLEKEKEGIFRTGEGANLTLIESAINEEKRLTEAINTQFPQFIEKLKGLFLENRESDFRLKLGTESNKQGNIGKQIGVANKLGNIVLKDTELSDLSERDVGKLKSSLPLIKELKDTNKINNNIKDFKGINLSQNSLITKDEALESTSKLFASNQKEFGIDIANKIQLELEGLIEDSFTNSVGVLNTGIKTSVNHPIDYFGGLLTGKNSTAQTNEDANSIIKKILSEDNEKRNSTIKTSEKSLKELNIDDTTKKRLTERYDQVQGLLSDLGDFKSLPDLNREFESLGSNISNLNSLLQSVQYESGTFTGPIDIKRAGGGYIPGAGNSDSIPAMLTPGEFVIRKSAAEALGSDTLHQLNGYNTGGYVKFAEGGEVRDRKLAHLRGETLDPTLDPKSFGKYKEGSIAPDSSRPSFIDSTATGGISLSGHSGTASSKLSKVELKIHNERVVKERQEAENKRRGVKQFDLQDKLAENARKREETGNSGSLSPTPDKSVSRPNSFRPSYRGVSFGKIVDNRGSDYSRGFNGGPNTRYSVRNDTSKVSVYDAESRRKDKDDFNKYNKQLNHERELARIRKRASEQEDREDPYRAKPTSTNAQLVESVTKGKPRRYIRTRKRFAKGGYVIGSKEYENKIAEMLPGSTYNSYVDNVDTNLPNQPRVAGLSEFENPPEHLKNYLNPQPEVKKVKSEGYYQRFPEERPENQHANYSTRNKHLAGNKFDGTYGSGKANTESFGKYGPKSDKDTPTVLRGGSTVVLGPKGIGLKGDKAVAEEARNAQSNKGQSPLDLYAQSQGVDFKTAKTKEQQRLREKFQFERATQYRIINGEKVDVSKHQGNSDAMLEYNRVDEHNNPSFKRSAQKSLAEMLEGNKERRKLLGRESNSSLGKDDSTKYDNDYNKYNRIYDSTKKQGGYNRNNSYFGSTTSINLNKAISDYEKNKRISELESQIKSTPRYSSGQTPNSQLKSNKERNKDRAMFEKGNRTMQFQESMKRMDRFEMWQKDFKNKPHPFHPGPPDKKPYVAPPKPTLPFLWNDTEPVKRREYGKGQRSNEMTRKPIHRASGGGTGSQTIGGGKGLKGMELSISSESLEKFNNAINNFSKPALTLAESLDNMPKIISLQGEYSLNINLNGAEVLRSLEEKFSKMVMQQVTDGINDFIDKKAPHLGRI